MVSAVNDYFGLAASSGNFTNWVSSGDYTNWSEALSNNIFANNTNLGYNNCGTIWGMNTEQLQQSYDYQMQYRSYNNKMNAGQITLVDQCQTLASVVSEGKEDEVLTEFNELVSTLASQAQYQGLSDKELKAYAKQIFQQTTGVSLTDAINENCSGGFGTGFKFAFFGSKADTVSKEDLLAEINGTKKSAGSTVNKIFGGIIGTLVGSCTMGLSFLFGSEH